MVEFQTEPITDGRISIVEILRREVGVRQFLFIVCNCLCEAHGKNFGFIVLGSLDFEYGSRHMLDHPGISISRRREKPTRADVSLSLRQEIL